MKAVIVSIVLSALTLCASAQVATNQPAQLKWKITCFEGSTNSGTSGSCINSAPENDLYGSGGGDTVTSPGIEHELRWTFVGRNGSKDLYDFTFTRMTKAGSSDTTTTSKQVQFDGKRIVIFKDDLHTVIMESLDTNDLKLDVQRNSR